MKGGVRGRKEFPKKLIDLLFELKENEGYKAVDDIINEAVSSLEINDSVVNELKKGSLNIRMSPENMEKISTLAESSKTQVGKKILGGNDTAVITFALEKFLEKRKTVY